MKVRRIGRCIHPITGEVGTSLEITVSKEEMEAIAVATSIKPSEVVPLAIMKRLLGEEEEK